MIKSFQATSPELQTLLGEEAIAFGPNINLVMGPNGAGKTSLLKAVAWQCAIPEEGQPRPLTYGDWKLKPAGESWRREQYKTDLGTDFLKGVADWDGEFAYLFRPLHYLKEARSMQDVGEMQKLADWRQNAIEKRSSGTETLSLLDRLDQRILSKWPKKDFLEEAIALYKKEEVAWGGKVEKDWRKSWSHQGKWNEERVAFITWVESLRKAGRSNHATLLLDEPDEHLSPTAILKLYTEVLPGYAARGIQIIVVSHSAFSLTLRAHGANVIALGPDGYLADVEQAIHETHKALAGMKAAR